MHPRTVPKPQEERLERLNASPHTWKTDSLLFASRVDRGMDRSMSILRFPARPPGNARGERALGTPVQ